MVSRARSRMAHCFGVRFRVSSRTMWSWSPRESNNIRIACGCHESLPLVSPQLHAHLLFLLFSLQSSDFPLQATPAPPTWLQKDPTYPEYLEFGKLAQLLGSSEDQLGALGRERIIQSREVQTPLGSRELGKGHSRRKWKGAVLTVWSVSGGSTIVLSIVFITTRQSSFSTRFRTVFSHTEAKSVRLQGQAAGQDGVSARETPP